MQQVLLLMLAGGAGTVARYGVDSGVSRLLPDPALPWGTLVVNALGCLLFGLVYEWIELRTAAHVRLVVLVGFAGAFTTFSTYAFHTAQLADQGRLLAAVANLAAHNVLGLTMVFAGLWIGRAALS